MKNHGYSWLALVCLQLVACGASETETSSVHDEGGAAGNAGSDAGEAGSDVGGATGTKSAPSPRSDDDEQHHSAGAGGNDAPTGPLGGFCIISADCPSASHCDLGECVQDCNNENPCKKGLVCSERARCIEKSGSDTDPAPVTSQVGTISVDPAFAEIAEQDTTFDVRLSTTSMTPVEYRVDLRAPFLALIGDARGTVTDEKALSFRVSPRGLSAAVTPGTILIHTALGDAVVSPSIRVGVGGTYQGVMRYLSGSTAFGDVSIAAVVRDDHGDIEMALDPERSMTFPRMQSGLAAGHGRFTFSDGLAVTVTQSIDANYGESRNHFQRPLGRQVRFSLKPSRGGHLEGTFEETVYGLFARPIVLHGTAYLEPREVDRSLDFTVPDATPPISGTSAFSTMGVFAGWGDTSAQYALGGCWRGVPYGECGRGDLACISNVIEQKYYAGLNSALSSERTSAHPVDDLADVCEAELSGRGLGGCAYVPPLACALRDIGITTWNGASDLSAAQGTYNRLFARTLAPALLVAQSHIVRGLKSSFQTGANAEAAEFKLARSVLDAPLSFVLSSGALQFLQTTPVVVAAGDASSTDSTRTNFPAGRALARALYVMHTLDGEEARRDAADLTTSQSDKLRRAQERGVLGLLEAIALSSVMDAWQNPPNLGNEFVGSLTLADRGFQALQQGALAFGVPEGQVPIAFDPAVLPNYNFGQILDVHAKPTLELAASDETAFTAAEREFEQNATALQGELEAVRGKFEDQIAEICGNEFELDAAKGVDFSNCGASGHGTVAELSLDIEQANLRLQAAQARLDGMGQKLAIDQKRLADTQGVREATLQFTNSVGKQYTTLTIAEGFINAAEKAIEVASNANLLNGGAPLAGAVMTAVLEAQRTALQVTRQELQNAQQMRALADEKQLELINGLAALQTQAVDMAQVTIEIQQESLGVTQADLRRRDLLEKAKRLFEERARSLVRISTSPLTDPIYRVLESRLALIAQQSRADAQTWLYRAGRALEYEINKPLGDALGRAVLGAYNAHEASRLANCLRSIYSEYSTTFGTAQEYSTTFSVRQMLGISGPRTDEVTGQTLSEGELFRRAVLKNENFDAQGALTITFPTNLQPGNQLWATNLCNDKVATVQAQLVGDFQGDNQAQIVLALEGGALLRRCDSDEIANYKLEGSAPPIDVGVNTFGDAKPNSFLYGQSVARASWKVTIQAGADVPSNADLRLDHLEDIVIRVTHKALPRKNQATPIDMSCLGTVGAG